MSESKGVLAGTWLGPRPVAKFLEGAGFTGDELSVAVMVAGSESWLYSAARNDNLDASGNVVSRDCGFMQFNIPASEIGTDKERELYDPATCAAAAYKLWSARGWEPWVGYTSDAYLHDTYALWSFIGVGNRWMEIVNGLQVTAGYASAVKVPALSIPTARKTWPGIPLG